MLAVLALASPASAATPDVVLLSLKSSNAKPGPGCGGRAAQLETLRAAAQKALYPRYRILTHAPAKAVIAHVEIARMTSGGIEQWDTTGVTDLDETPPPGVLRAIAVPVMLDASLTRLHPAQPPRPLRIAPDMYQDTFPRDEPRCGKDDVAVREALSRAGAVLGARIQQALAGRPPSSDDITLGRLIPRPVIGDYLGENGGRPIDRHWIWREEPSMAMLAAYAPPGRPSWGRLDCVLAADGRLEHCRVSRRSRAGAGAAALKAVHLYRMKTVDPFGNPLAGRSVQMWIRFGMP